MNTLELWKRKLTAVCLALGIGMMSSQCDDRGAVPTRSYYAQLEIDYNPQCDLLKVADITLTYVDADGTICQEPVTGRIRKQMRYDHQPMEIFYAIQCTPKQGQTFDQSCELQYEDMSYLSLYYDDAYQKQNIAGVFEPIQQLHTRIEAGASEEETDYWMDLNSYQYRFVFADNRMEEN